MTAYTADPPLDPSPYAIGLGFFLLHDARLRSAPVLQESAARADTPG
jgi:hypothetical protein